MQVPKVFAKIDGMRAGLLFILLSLMSAHAIAQATGDSLQPGKLFGEATLTTNWVERGITQTDKGYAMQAGLGYRWTYFKTGLWGSNIKLPDTSDSLNLRLYLSYKFVFTNSADLTFRYDLNRYYQGGSRNGSIIGFDLNLFQYHILYERNDSWEGLGAATRVGFWKEWQVPYNLFVNLNTGYNMIADGSRANYFDAKTLLSYKYADIVYSLGHSYNSQGSQYDGRGNMFIFLQLAAQF